METNRSQYKIRDHVSFTLPHASAVQFILTCQGENVYFNQKKKEKRENLDMHVNVIIRIRLGKMVIYVLNFLGFKKKSETSGTVLSDHVSKLALANICWYQRIYETQIIVIIMNVMPSFHLGLAI